MFFNNIKIENFKHPYLGNENTWLDRSALQPQI